MSDNYDGHRVGDKRTTFALLPATLYIHGDVYMHKTRKFIWLKKATKTLTLFDGWVAFKQDNG